MYEVSDKFKQYCKRHQRFFKEATITYEDGGITKTINSNNIIKLEISATPYVDYQILGQTPGKKIHINLRGTNYNLTNKEISVKTTMIYDDNTTEDLTLGNYIISSDYESQVKDQCSFTGYDYMIKFDQKYSDEGLDQLNDIKTCGSTALGPGIYSAIHLIGNQTGGTILQFPLQGTLQLDDSSESNISEELTPSYYMKDFKSSRLYGPVNRVQLTLSNIEDATYIEDSESIRQNGIQTITINDNYFLGTIEAREYAINNLWTALSGLTYIPFSSTYLGFPYLEMGDLIEIEQLDGTTIESYVFNYTFTYNGGYMGKLETPTISRTQEEYPTNSIDSKVMKIGVNVDRANAEIEAVVEDVSGVKADLSLKIDKDDNDQIISMINASADIIRLDSNRLIINSSNFILTEDGDITAISGTIGGFTLGVDSFTADLVSPYEYTQADITRINQIILGEVTPTYEDYERLDVDRNHKINILDRLQINRYVQGTSNFTGEFTLNTKNSLQALQIKNESNDIVGNIGIFGSYFRGLASENLYTGSQIFVSSDSTGSYGVFLGRTTFSDGNIEYQTNEIRVGDSDGLGGQIVLTAHTPTISLVDTNSAENILINGDSGNIRCVSLTQTSKAEEKKDFEKYQGALKEIENIDIYKYRMKKEDGKKHIGFVIGDDFKYSQEVTNQNNDGVDVYSFVSLCCQAIKELQEEIKELRGKINE